MVGVRADSEGETLRLGGRARSRTTAPAAPPTRRSGGRRSPARGWAGTPGSAHVHGPRRGRWRCRVRRPAGVRPSACIGDQRTSLAGVRGTWRAAVPPNVTTARWISARSSSSSAKVACISATARLRASIFPSAAMLPLTSASRMTGSGRADATVNSFKLWHCSLLIAVPFVPPPGGDGGDGDRESPGSGRR